MLVSIIIRTYNESEHLESLLTAISKQSLKEGDYEIIIVDSGSTDKTLDIASKFQTKIVPIKKEDFSFGRSLNYGCEAAKGEVCVFISGHCIPVDNKWLSNLISPLVNEQVEYIYGSQIGGRDSKFSECNLFNKYYGEESQIPQEDFFCNNANSALVRSVWLAFQFDETLTGLEDMELAKRLINNKKKIGYSAEAKVFHLHNETWKQISWRYEREAFALKNIMPEIHVNLWDFLRFTINAIIIDSVSAFKKKIFFKKLKEIILFRIMQYWGTYRGNQEHRKLSAKMKERYFYPG